MYALIELFVQLTVRREKKLGSLIVSLHKELGKFQCLSSFALENRKWTIIDSYTHSNDLNGDIHGTKMWRKSHKKTHAFLKI